MSTIRPCEKCGKRFKPYSPATKLCDDCWEQAHEDRRINNKFKMKENKKYPYKRSRK